MLHVTKSAVCSAASLMMMLFLVPETAGSGQIEVLFVSYSSNCDLDYGSACDPMFTFCLGRPQSSQTYFKDYICNYEKTLTSTSYVDTNYIYFKDQTSIGGLPNPWIINTATFSELSVMIAVELYDSDPANPDDLMVVFYSSIPVAVAASRNEAQWSRQVLRDGTYYMDFDIRLYCDPGYFTSSCNVNCSPQNTSSGHYTCQAGTGKKICMQGWNGTSCSDDINECTLGFCLRGNCTNLPGDYMCTCPQNYTGKNCSVLKNPCLSTSCLNGGTCYAHPTEYTYLCRCPAGWEGNHCETRTNPCNSQPCLNGGLCNS
ncbi:delta-like protein C, partial [Physella acuta]|uniref:delta-like protein C n=1 Tax=Physella acuta TaxID=109671 RepID=UPI0027DAC1E9